MKKIKFIIGAIVLAILTIALAFYVANLLFSGKNSLKVYDSLKRKKAQLEYNIIKMQQANAKLQKDYFELKNLEPEQ